MALWRAARALRDTADDTARDMGHDMGHVMGHDTGRDAGHDTAPRLEETLVGAPELAGAAVNLPDGAYLS